MPRQDSCTCGFLYHNSHIKVLPHLLPCTECGGIVGDLIFLKADFLHVQLIVQHFVATFTGHSMRELASYAPIKVLPHFPHEAKRGIKQGD